MASATPLSTLYLQIEQGQTPAAVLGIDHNSTRADVREAYHALALRVHPDKAPTDSLRELHTSLFKKVNAAWEFLLKHDPSYANVDGDDVQAPKQLPETWDSLRARNAAFKEALREAREGALKAKRAEKAKKESLADGERVSKKQKQARKMQEQARKKQAEKMRRERDMEKEVMKQNGEYRKTQGGVKTAPEAAGVVDWEEEESRLQEQERVQAAGAETSKATTSQGFAESAPTYTSGASKSKKALAAGASSKADIQAQWNKTLLSGGRSGTVSLSQKKARDEKKALAHQKISTLHEMWERVELSSLAAVDYQDGLEYEASVEAEFESDVRTLRALETMDRDVLAEHLDGGLDRMRAMLAAEARAMGIILE